MSVHASLGIAIPSQHTVSHMANALETGTLTAECLRASLVQSDGYRSSVRTRFRDTCYTLLGDDDEEGFRLFDLKFGIVSTSESQVEVSDEEIDRAVRQGARFESRYVDLIRRNHMMLKSGTQASEEFVAAMMARFRTDMTFSLEAVQTMIRAMPHGRSDEHQSTPERQMDAAEAEAVEQQEIESSAGCARESSSQIVRSLDPGVVHQVLLVGDREYGRPWYAIEMIAYMEECVNVQATEASIHDHVKTLLRDHTDAWDQARAVHARLLGEELDELEFVRRYVGRHQVSGFAEMLSIALMDTPLYEERIRGRLLAVQARLYDVPLSDDEVRMLILQSRSVGVGVSDDDVSGVLHAHRRECDGLVSEVVGVYVEVLSREPDQTELCEDVKRFRATGATSGCLQESRVALAVRLAGGYEFHDVVKTRLRSAYHQACGGGIHVPLQVLYQMLERVLIATETTLRANGGGKGLATLVETEIRNAIYTPNA